MTNTQLQVNKSELFVCKSGLTINRYESVWHLLAHKGKGANINLSWLYSSSNLPVSDREIILDIFTFYARTKAASTVATLNYAVTPFFKSGVISLNELKSIWSSLQVNQKKGRWTSFL